MFDTTFTYVRNVYLKTEIVKLQNRAFQNQFFFNFCKFFLAHKQNLCQHYDTTFKTKKQHKLQFISFAKHACPKIRLYVCYTF